MSQGKSRMRRVVTRCKRGGAGLTRGMNVTALGELHHHRPFVPYTLSLADGRKLHVRHMDYLTISPAGRLAILSHDDDTFTMIDLNPVVTADTGEMSASAAGS